MLLSELAKKNDLWFKMAFDICKDKNDAADLVQEMYIRRFENDNGQPCTDQYIRSTILSIYLNGKSKKRHFPQEEIFKGGTDENFEPNDKEKILLDKHSELTFAERELIDLSYNYSIRQIAEKYKVSYGYVFRKMKEARTKILGKQLTEYNNQRNKRMAKKKKDAEYYNSLDKRSVEYQTWIAGRESVGLGDTIEKITTATGIKKLVHLVAGEDCGCEERKKVLNEYFKYKEKIKCMTPEQIAEYKHFVETRKIKLIGEGVGSGRLKPIEIEFICTLFAEIFNRQLFIPTCSSCSGTAQLLLTMIYKLEVVYENSI